MYLRKSTRRRLTRAGFLVAALVMLTPRIDLAAAPQLATLLGVMGEAPPSAVLDS